MVYKWLRTEIRHLDQCWTVFFDEQNTGLTMSITGFDKRIEASQFDLAQLIANSEVIPYIQANDI